MVRKLSILSAELRHLFRTTCLCSELGFAQSLTSVPITLHCYHYVNLNYANTN